MIDFFWNFASFVVALGVLVAVHEWGHFWVARRCGVKVERFSIGFGKALWKRKDKLGTEYVIAAIPLGGYVKMLDERVDQVSDADLPHAFNRQSVGKRIAIIAAGPAVNFLFAIVALYVMFLIGSQAVKPVVGEVMPDSIFAKANIEPGVVISKIGEHQVYDWQDVNLELMSAIGRSVIDVAVDTQEGFSKTYSLDLSNWQFDPDKTSSISSLGIVPFRPSGTTKIAYVEQDSPGFHAGLQTNDIIMGINGTPVQNWEQTVELIEQNPQQDVVIDVNRDGNWLSLNGTLGVRQTQDARVGFLGVSPFTEPWPENYVFDRQYGPIDSLLKASSQTWRLITISVEMIGKLITGDVSVKNLSGPISIAQGAGASASVGIVAFLYFLALISVNLGIINLLPLPVLDGGHLLYYFIELFTGRPVSESVQEIGFKIGGVVLLLLMSVALFNDIVRL